MHLFSLSVRVVQFEELGKGDAAFFSCMLICLSLQPHTSIITKAHEQTVIDGVRKLKRRCYGIVSKLDSENIITTQSHRQGHQSRVKMSGLLYLFGKTTIAV